MAMKMTVLAPGGAVVADQTAFACEWCRKGLQIEPEDSPRDAGWRFSLSQGWLCEKCRTEGDKIDAGFTAEAIVRSPSLAATYYPHTAKKWFGQDWYEGRTSTIE